MNIFRILVVSLIILINFILESTLFQYIQLFGINPNTSIIIIVSFAILRYEIGGAMVGFFIGLLYDIFLGQSIGLSSLIYLFIGYFCGKPFKSFYRESFILPLFLVFFSSISYGFCYYIIMFLFKGRLDIIYYFKSIIIPETFYTILLTIPIYRIIYAINKFLEELEKPNRKLFLGGKHE